MRKQVNLYHGRSPAVAAAASGGGGGGDGEAVADEEAVRLDELLSGLTVDDEAHRFRVDEADARFLSGAFVPPVSSIPSKHLIPSSSLSSSKHLNPHHLCHNPNTVTLIISVIIQTP